MEYQLFPLQYLCNPTFDPTVAMEIPWQNLNPDTLENLIQELVTRDGTDYGERETSLADKVSQVKRRLASGQAYILYDEALEVCEILLRDG